MPMFDLSLMNEEIGRAPLFRKGGRIRSATGLLSCSLSAAVGDRCEIHPGEGRSPVLAEVIGFSDGLTYLAPYDNLDQVAAGMPVVHLDRGLTPPVGRGRVPRVEVGHGPPLDRRGAR